MTYLEALDSVEKHQQLKNIEAIHKEHQPFL